MALAARDDKKQAFFRIYAELLVEGTEPADAAADGWTEAFLVATTKASSGITPPKYFSGDPPKREKIAAIDAVAARDTTPGAAATEEEKEKAENAAIELYGDLFHLCMSLKSRPGVPATVEDANFSAACTEAFFRQTPEQAQEASLEALGRLVDGVLEQGCCELAASPAKLRAVLLMFAHPRLAEVGDFEVLKKLLQLSAQLYAETAARETLIGWYAKLPLAVLEKYLSQVQQFVTISLIMAQEQTGNSASLEVAMELAKRGDLARHIRNALRLLDIFWHANSRRRDFGHRWQTRRKAQLLHRKGELLESEEVDSLPLTQFHNDAINECEGMLKHDLKEVLERQSRNIRNQDLEDAQRNDFGVIQFAFVLTPVSKVRMLNIESLLMQREEVRTAMAVQMMLRGRMSTNPFLVLKVRRNAVIEDALQQLAIYGSHQFKKPLKVMFDGEEAVDEGGVQKEFFQLLVQELYNEDFGMFERVDESRNFWFNKNSFEANLQFELFGIVLGLAIYNQVILDVKFPMSFYQKVIGGKTAPKLGLSDLLDFQPSLAQGLIALLEHEPGCASFEEVFGPLFFLVEYECFGSVVQAELKEGGKDIPVTFENREDYAQRYCDWIFNTSVERQFSAFRKGFDSCMGDTLFRQLFRADELELVICGSIELDFRALEEAAQYQDGFTAGSDTVRWFWEVVHALSKDEKRSLLQFCTGCDRAPVGGLGRLQFIVSRAGPDSDMLPWVHTCFNHLLLPEYGSKEKLERRLRLAIQHSTGFGLM